MVKALLDSQAGQSLKNILQAGIDEGLRYYGQDADNISEMAYFTRMFHLDELERLEEKEIKSSGYVVDTLEAAVWCLITTDSFAECLLKVVNLGDDTDTVAAVAGGLAGLFYGIDAMPGEWLGVISQKEYLVEMCERADGLYNQ